MEFDQRLKPADYAVTFALLLVPLGIGVLFAIRDAKRSTRDDFLVGGRKMAMLPVALSIFVTSMSAISLMGYPTDVYTYGAMISTVFIGFSCSYVIGLYTVIPLVYPLHRTSLYEYLELRFESSVLRVAIVAVGMLQSICHLTVALLSPGLALQATAGIPYWVSVVSIGGIGTVYSAIGGIKSVVWANAFQAVVLMGAILPSIVKACLAVGGPQNVWRIATDGGRTSFDVISLDPRERHTWWGTVIGGIFMWLVNIFSQSSIQRMCSMKTIKEAKQSFVINIIIVLVYGALLYGLGICIYAYFTYMKCDPFQAGLITNRNQLPPYFVLQALRDLPGMAGLYMAIIFGSSLSTFSSGINALAANTVEDILKSSLRRVNESTATLVTRLVVFVFGIAITGLAYGARALKGPVTQMGFSVIGACGGPVVGVFFLGASIPWSNKYGAMAGATVALALNLWLAIGNQVCGREIRALPAPAVDLCFGNRSVTFDNYTTDDVLNNVTHSINPVVNDGKATKRLSGDSYSSGYFMYDISYLWYGVIGFLTSFLVGSAVSFGCNKLRKHSRPDSRLIFPFIRELCSLPAVMPADLKFFPVTAPIVP